MILDLDWTQIGVGVIVSGTIMAIALGLWRIGPIGAQTVATLKELRAADAEKLKVQDEALLEQSETIADLQDRNTRLELTVKDKEIQIARLEERPNTEAILSEISTSSAVNHEALAGVSETQQRTLEISERIADSLDANTAVLQAIEKHITAT